MELNANSWFVSTYLQIGKYNRPKTFCDLFSRFMFVTFLYLLVAFSVGIIIAIYAYGAYIQYQILFNDFVQNPKDALEMVGPVIFWFANAGALLWFVILPWSVRGFAKLNEYQTQKLEARIAEGYNPNEPNAFIQCVKAWAEQIKEKTCVLVTFKDEQED